MKDILKTNYGKKFVHKLLRFYKHKIFKARRIADSIIKVNTLKSSFYLENLFMNLTFNYLITLSELTISYKKAYKVILKCNNKRFKAFMVNFKKESMLKYNLVHKKI